MFVDRVREGEVYARFYSGTYGIQKCCSKWYKEANFLKRHSRTDPTS